MKKVTVYRNGAIRTLKQGVDFAEYKKKFPNARKVKVPSHKTMERWMDDGYCRTIDGCKTEPDGDCPHGFPSWLIALGYI